MISWHEFTRFRWEAIVVIELEDVSEVIALLQLPESEQALSYWNDVLEPYLGRDAWLGDGGAALAELLNYWAPESAAELAAATQQGATDGGSALMAWLDAAVQQGQSRADSLADYYPDSAPMDAQGVSDATGADASGTWYVGEPQPVPERDGWWAAVDASGQWWAVQADVCPDAATVGWVVYEEAFAAPEAQAPAWVESKPGAQPAQEGPTGEGPAIGRHRSAAATTAQAPDQPPNEASEEPVDEDERWEELVAHNKEVLDHTKNDAELPLVIVRSPGGMFVRETGGFGCLLAPTSQVLHSREVFFQGTAVVRREKFHFYLDFVGIPQEYRSACSCCLGYVPDYEMRFFDSAGAALQDSGAFLPYGARFGGSVADPVPDPPDLEHAAMVNSYNWRSHEEDLQWQLGKNGLLLIGVRMLDEGAVGYPGYHSQQNLIAMGERLPGHVVGGGSVSVREDRRGRVTAVVFHSVKGENRDAVMQEAKRADPKMKFELVSSD